MKKTVYFFRYGFLTTSTVAFPLGRNRSVDLPVPMLPFFWFPWDAPISAEIKYSMYTLVISNMVGINRLNKKCIMEKQIRMKTDAIFLVSELALKYFIVVSINFVQISTANTQIIKHVNICIS